MKFCRIDLSKTSYHLIENVRLMSNAERDDKMHLLQNIYKEYCAYKKFDSVMPLFVASVFDKYTDVFGYYDSNKLVAFSLVKRYDRENAESLQFAWDYSNPMLRLGVKSLEHECAYYKNNGFKYLYLGQTDYYKTQFQGYELLTNPYI